MGARALWIEMLCLMHDSEPRGYLVVRDKPLTDRQIAQQAGCATDEVTALLAELADAGVFSQTSGGVIFSRKMVRESRVSEEQRQKAEKRWNRAPYENIDQIEIGNAKSDAVANAETMPIFQKLEPERKMEANASLSPAGDVEPNYPEPFEAAWKAYPHVRGRSSKPKALGFWRRLPKPHRDQLPAAASRYAREGREPKAECGAAGMHLWIRDQKFLDWLAPEPSAAPSVSEWSPDRWRAVLANFHERGLWSDAIGPKPGEIGCLAPAVLMAENQRERSLL